MNNFQMLIDEMLKKKNEQTVKPPAVSLYDDDMTCMLATHKKTH